MSDATKTLSALTALVLIVSAVSGTLGYTIGYQSVPDAPKPPFCVNDAQAVMAKIRPLLAGGMFAATQADVFLWSDGTVNIEADIDGSKLHGTGPTLAAAVVDLSKAGASLRAALAAK
jgi:hypothetical protein